MMWYSIRY